MKLRTALLAACAVASTAMTARTFTELTAAMSQPATRHAQVEVEIIAASAEKPVIYSIELWSMAPSDTLSPCDYLIEWRCGGGSEIDGFNSYHDGTHFRYGHNRLREYHFADQPEVFTTPDGGVQCKALFVDLLPPIIAGQLTAQSADTTFTTTFNEATSTLSGAQRIAGYTSKEFNYKFDPVSGLPVRIDNEYSPGTMSEQSFTAEFVWDNNPDGIELDEQALAARYSDIFKRFRETTLSASNLVGTPLPTFSARTPDRNRVTHTRGEALDCPTVIVFVDDDGITGDALEKVRTDHPGHAVWIACREKTSHSYKDTTTLLGTSALHRACGITACPAVVVLGSDGTITAVSLPSGKQ